jgi:hypothetical protein
MRQFMIVDAVKYAVDFIPRHFWAMLKMVLVFMAAAIVIGVAFKVSPLEIMTVLSKYLGVPFTIETSYLLVFPLFFILYAMWNVSFITYLLSLERMGSALMGKELKKSVSVRVLKIMLFDLVIILFFLLIALVFSGIAFGTWWFGGMQMALWLRIVLSIFGSALLACLIYLLMRLFFTKVVLVDTNTDFFTAMSASWSATKGWFWRLVFMVLVVGVIGGMVTIISAQLSLLIAWLLGGSMIGMVAGKMIEVFAAVINFVFAPVVTLYYYLQLKVARSLIAGR